MVSSQFISHCPERTITAKLAKSFFSLSPQCSTWSKAAYGSFCPCTCTLQKFFQQSRSKKSGFSHFSRTTVFISRQVLQDRVHVVPIGISRRVISVVFNPYSSFLSPKGSHPLPCLGYHLSHLCLHWLHSWPHALTLLVGIFDRSQSLHCQ